MDIQIIGSSNPFLDVMDQISRAAPMERPVLVIGERGTGKELIAARLHYLSQRWNMVYQKMNCAALPENLLESELFGYEAGAFTGASKRRKGRFEIAHEGSLFLDEIGTLTSAAQEKLLRVIEYGEFERLGGNDTIHVDVRVIGATNIDLPAAADIGEFRHDLLDRLAFDVITVPPLRERKEDIPVLTDFFGQRMAKEQEWLQFPGFTDQAMEAMMAHQWPGNIRELKNVVERAVYRAWDGEAPLDDIVFDPFESPYRPQVISNRPVQKNKSEQRNEAEALNQQLLTEPVVSHVAYCMKTKLQEMEKQHLTLALEQHKFNQRKTAEHLNLSYDQLRHALKRHTLL
ncbi:phage shock protein operon transcriptional activator [Temperatibacter marinus]|uniref:Phage shock protein operon transcriptional activator n=1 Tax=Temperatibacter marinus TaxID=1456591 RepID=A0AA52EJU7_9PROT|nr:phage shock protein operon transcriptional activator [Temperatibacter marinus]WND03356.1 phage shock protein operon transcriptional activator [Temperatibacter marinus]